MRKNDMAGEKQSLTPQQPLDPRELAAQLEGLWQVETQSGVRVFHDYMPVEFQARAELVDLLEMELAHRRHPSFAGLGRYSALDLSAGLIGARNEKSFRVTGDLSGVGGLSGQQSLCGDIQPLAAGTASGGQYLRPQRLPGTTA